MADAAENIIERHELYLDELARMTLVLARDQQQRALEADNPEQAAVFGRLYNATARSLRQTLALKARLDRECRIANRERREQSAARKARRPTPHAAPSAHRWTETERLDCARELNGEREPNADSRPDSTVPQDAAAFDAAPLAGRSPSLAADPPWRSSA